MSNEENDKEAFLDACKDMADDIATMLKAKGECSPKDLVLIGYAGETIERCWAFSYALAKSKLNWTDA